MTPRLFVAERRDIFLPEILKPRHHHFKELILLRNRL